MGYWWLPEAYGLDKVVLTASIVCGLGLGALYLLQTKLIYVPYFPDGSRRIVWKPSECGFHPKNDEEVFLTTADGLTIHGYWLSSGEHGTARPLPTVIYFQVHDQSMPLTPDPTIGQCREHRA